MAIPVLANKLVLVTGASSGIGKECALAFARKNARLILFDLNEAGLQSTAKEVCQLGASCEYHAVDVGNEASMRDAARRIHEVHGAVDVLVNNAGVAFLGSFLETPLSQWQRLLQINLLGVVHGCNFFLPEMMKAGGARHVVNMASAAGLAPTFNMSAYAASKHAVIGLSDSLALELSNSSVGVSVVCPGIINTPIVNPSPSNVGASITFQQLARLSTFYKTKGAHPSVVADAIVRAVQTAKGLVLVGPYAALIYHMRRISRALLARILINDSKKAGWI
ncbi:MAG TPA: SDR family NAD(P)-dependent oxidoreductase [Burkholderiaceae bacterium]|nr:SDR family NAD(P)-dependent oxidoreductase [Burkholderiaceae bacterium]